MTRPILSILILSIETRAKYLARLESILRPQQCDEIEILVNLDDGDRTIGAKRNELLDVAQGDYFAFIDDDDTVSDDYGQSILVAARCKPDAIGFDVRCMVDGQFDRDALISVRHGEWQTTTRDGKRTHLRTPNHLSPVRREIALRHRFPDINSGEDAEYSRRIFPDIRSENRIGKTLYTYEFRSNPLRAGEKTNGQKLTGKKAKRR